jgi:hypothetical protein
VIGKDNRNRTLEDRSNNDHTESKVALRCEAVALLGPPRPITVLDAYHGDGLIWDAVERQLADGWSVKLFRSDRVPSSAGVLKVDNARLLEAIDLTRFDLIDLDAWGFPDKQLRIVARRAPKTPVITTRVCHAMANAVTNLMLADLGFNLGKDYPLTLLAGIADELWEAWLYQLGYRTSRMLRFDHYGGGHGHSSNAIKRYELLIPEGFTAPT